MEIRCCCDPSIILGEVPGINPDLPKIRFLLKSGKILELPIGTVYIPVERTNSFHTNHRAIKSMDTPIEILREIPDFVEA